MKRLADYFVTCRTTFEELSGNSAVHLNKPESGNAPLVDIGVLFPMFGERPLPGFQVLETTPYGTSADCNSGVLAAETVLLCFRRCKNSLNEREIGGVDGKTESVATPLELAPITDIRLIYLDKEPVPAGYTIVEKSVSGSFPGNLNYGYGGRKVFLCVKRAPKRISLEERYHSLRPIVDVCIINTSKKERPPVGYTVLSKSTSEGNWTGSRMKLCIKRTAGIGLLDNSFLSTITEKVPSVNHADFPCPSGISLFTSPHGMKILRRHITNEPLPKTFSFLLTQDDGSRVHGTVLTFYERMDAEIAEKLESQYDKLLTSLLDTSPENVLVKRAIALRRRLLQGCSPKSYASISSSDTVLDEDDQDTADEEGGWSLGGKDKVVLYAPICICIISHLPFYRGFKEFLTMMYQLSISRSSIPIERFVGHFMSELPVPTPGGPGFVLRFGAGHGATVPVEFKLPTPRGLPLCSVNFFSPLRFLSPTNFTQLFTLLLLEKSILMHSAYLSVLTQVGETMRSLLFPFDWQFIYVPVCPRDMLGILDAPVPFFVGTSTVCIREMSLVAGVWEVDLDNDTIHCHEEKAVIDGLTVESINPMADKSEPKLPPKIRVGFVERIKTVIERFPLLEPSEGNSGPKLRTDPDLAYSIDPIVTLAQPSLDRIEKLIRDAALLVVIELVGDYREHLVPLLRRKEGTSISIDELRTIFNVEEFISSAPRANQSFLTEQVKTLAFCKFVDERTYGALSSLSQKFLFFDAAIQTSAKSKSDVEEVSTLPLQSPGLLKNEVARPSSLREYKRKSLSRSQSTSPNWSTSARNRHKALGTSPLSHTVKPTKKLGWFSRKRSARRKALKPSGSQISSDDIVQHRPNVYEEEKLLLEVLLEEADIGKSVEKKSLVVHDAGVGKDENVEALINGDPKYVYERFPRFNPALLGPNSAELGPKVIRSLEALVRDRVESVPNVSLIEQRKHLSLEKRASSFFIKGGALPASGEDDDRLKKLEDIVATAAVSDRHINRADSTTEQLEEAGVRTLEEVHRSRVQGRAALAEPVSWAQFSVMQVLGAWFCCLPRWLLEFDQPLRLTSVGLELVSTNFVLIADEASYRSLIVACSYSGNSFIADNERLLFDLMQFGGITPNALTYGFYSNSIKDHSHEKEFTAQRSWRKLRTLLKICSIFKSFVREQSAVVETSTTVNGADGGPGILPLRIIWSLTECFQCAHLILDQEVMAAWSLREDELTFKCPKCSTEILPKLSYRCYSSGMKEGSSMSEGQCEYMSPFRFRKQVELGVDSAMDPSSPLYWNLLWYFQRLKLYIPWLSGHVICGWNGKGTIDAALRKFKLGDPSLTPDRVEVGTIQKSKVRASERMDAQDASSSSRRGQSPVSARKEPLYTLWGNRAVLLSITAQLWSELPSFENSLVFSSQTTPEIVFRTLFTYLQQGKLAQAIVLFLAARKASTSTDEHDSGVLRGWEAFSSSMYLELKALSNMVVEMRQLGDEHGTKDSAAFLDEEYSTTLSKMKGIDQERSKLIAESDHAPSVAAQCFSSVFGELYP